jgi:ABC-2 type transport system ATP-binding protein
LAETILKIDKLSKRYGRIRAVNGLDLQVDPGNVYGILGPNGSGKTTTLGMILSIINPDSGSFSWFGNQPSKQDRKRIGSIVEVPYFYPYLSGLQNLKVFADIKGSSYDGIEKALKIVDLTARRQSRFKTYSLGMKQRLAIAAAILGDPRVLILDEPTNGLDPQGIAEIRKLIIRIAGEGITIILASHLLDEVQKICSHVCVLDKGRNIFAGKVEDVLNASEMIEIGAADISAVELVLKDYDKVESMERENSKLLVALKPGLGSSDLNKYLFEKGIVLSHITTKKMTLEKHFLELLNNS